MADKLFTWVDVDSRLAEAAVDGEWPHWLLEADAWWDGLELSVHPGTGVAEVREFLDLQFGLESAVDGEEGLELLLDRPASHSPRSLPVRLAETEDAQEVPRRPRLNERRLTSALSEPLPRPAAGFTGGRQVIAFHSFKGGVGRTLHAVALADLLASRGQHVLLVDADLEAPGITWMYQAQGGRCDIAYDDVLALLHASPDGDPTEAVQIAAAYLPNQEVSRHAGEGRVTILPSSRRTALGPPRIGPSDLLTEDRSPYFLTESLAALAVAAEADVVVLDLRAGASELSAPVLLDPRVTRVFVSTISSQSVHGTETMIHQVGTHAPALAGTDPAPGAIITQYRLDLHDGHADDARALLSDALSSAIALPSAVGNPAEDPHGDERLAVDEQVLTEPVLSPFREELLALPESWDEVTDVIRHCALPRLVAEFAPSSMLAPDRPAEDPEVLLHRRTSLAEFTGGLLEGGAFHPAPDSDFFTVEATRRLVADHRTDLPIAVVTGGPGTGKTFTFARMCSAGTWDTFAWTTGERVRGTAPIVPVLASPDAPDSIWDADSRHADAESLYLDNLWEHPPTGPERRDRIRALLDASTTHASAGSTRFWRDRWLDCLTIAAGAPDDVHGLDFLIHREALFVIDGVDEWLNAIAPDTETAVRATALHSLLHDVPLALRRFRRRSLGLVVFSRHSPRPESTVSRPSNRDTKPSRRASPYELQWTAEEALRFVLWLAARADAVPPPEGLVDALDEEEIVRCLLPLWGLRMGSDGSREAWTDRWFSSALADARERVQPRDVVRFLHEATVASGADVRSGDRVLSPAAMRQALAECGTAKIAEIRQQSPQVWHHLQDLAAHAAQEPSPFRASDVGLTLQAARRLERWGALSRTPDGRYQFPELYRLALGFRTEGRGRMTQAALLARAHLADADTDVNADAERSG
ncbi:KGGVGR-motif variant AAA ATPase [Streptomyces sp. CO7]